MKPRLPLLWLALVAMWLTLNGTLAVGEAILGALVAWSAVHALSRLQPAATGVRRPMALARLVGVVLLDIVRSNLAVATVVLRPGRRGRVSGFVDIPLETRHPTALAALACIITATPGTAWAGYDSRTNVVTIHVLDLVDDSEWVRTIKQRYEARLLEILE
ncbi:MAG TPA: Na+/H+ antiporter subunit E [Casimicrobiaceae bacterium]|nr:Na+/H+ antiporter subunit E [Casimicrobiaceae bacterium]